jgi:ABC-type Mn2+/Zn2+ transport system ATPase subunit
LIPSEEHSSLEASRKWGAFSSRDGHDTAGAGIEGTHLKAERLLRQIDAPSLWRRLSAFPAALKGWLDPGFRPELAARRDGIAITVTNVRVAYGRRSALEGVSDIAYSQSTRGRLAYLPQQSELDRDYPVTVAELVALGAWRSMGAFRPLSKDLLPSIDRAIAQVGLESFADRLIVELSVGQLRRALFARLIVQDASLILLDEPFAAIDEGTTAELVQLIKSWHSEQRTIIAVMHDLDQVRAYFPSTLLLARRCISWADTETALCADNLALANSAMREQVLDSLGAIV